MNQILEISLRNLARQKRRNVLLGTAIAFGAMMLILSSAFSHGISKVLFEQIVNYVYGHVAVSYMRNGNIRYQVFPDGNRIRKAIAEAVPYSLSSNESIGIFGRVIGNGAADNAAIVSINISGTLNEKERRELQANYRMLEGSFEALNDKRNGIPVILAEQKAKYLNVKLGDILRVRFIGVTGQTSSAQLIVVGIFKPANIFMSTPIFLDVNDLRMLAGYGPNDIAGLKINLDNPQRNAKKIADRIHNTLKPGLAVIPGIATLRGRQVNLLTFGFRTDSASLRQFRSALVLASGDKAKAFSYQGMMLSGSAAFRLSAYIGDTVVFRWPGQYDSLGGKTRWVVNGITVDDGPIPTQSMFVNERDFYAAYYTTLPAAPSPSDMEGMPDRDSANILWPALAPEFILMKRCATTEEYNRVTKELARTQYKGIVISVQSMYETASMIVNLELALNLVTLTAVMILFFIILIGVVNTLRMTIRERTREIGTLRAIGMQKRDVRTMFILETGFLALFASLAGMVAAFIAMWGLSTIVINAGDNPMGMLLVNDHLFFAPTALVVIGYVALIVAIAVITAYFPSRRAANLSAAAALRHYE